MTAPDHRLSPDPADRKAAMGLLARASPDELSAIAALEKSVAHGFGRFRADLRDAVAAGAAAQAAVGASGAAADSQTWRKQLSTLVDSIDVLQARVDVICAALQDRGASFGSARRSDRLLMLLVSGLGIVSGASLLLGLFAVFG